ncbi:MAG: SipW-dependent-type signal peptide-containing protein [Candidatus Aphodomorpha sp.]
MTKKALTILLAISLVALLAAGGAIAYLTSTDSVKNTFTVGNVKIVLDEAKVTKGNDGTWTAGTDRVKANDYGTVYPGAELPKDPTVHNTGANAAYIRAEVNVSNALNIFADLYPDAPTIGQDGYKDMLLRIVDPLGSGWSIVDVTFGDTMDYSSGRFDAKFILKYDAALASGESTTPMFTKVIVPTAMQSGREYLFKEITVTAQAIQADGFASWEAAFAAYDAQVN